MLERDAVPSDKVCGDFLSVEALRNVGDLGAGPASPRRGPDHRPAAGAWRSRRGGLPAVRGVRAVAARLRRGAAAARGGSRCDGVARTAGARRASRRRAAAHHHLARGHRDRDRVPGNREARSARRATGGAGAEGGCVQDLFVPLASSDRSAPGSRRGDAVQRRLCRPAAGRRRRGEFQPRRVGAGTGAGRGELGRSAAGSDIGLSASGAGGFAARPAPVASPGDQPAAVWLRSCAAAD